MQVEFVLLAANSFDGTRSENPNAVALQRFKAVRPALFTDENVNASRRALFGAYLAGPDSNYMTGQAPMIDGGMVYR